MRIVIAGAGEVGCHLAKLLSREKQEITVIDEQETRLAFLDANYNLLTITGSPISFDIQKKAGVAKCDLFIAVTPSETSNILACTMARSFGARKAVARIDNYEFMNGLHQDFFNTLGVNSLMYPEYLAAVEIIKALQRNWVRFWFEIHGGELMVVGVKIRDNAPLAGMKLRDLSMAEHFFHVSAIKRDKETIIPRGDDYIRPNDIVYFTTTADSIEDLREICGKTKYELKRIVIVGGSHIAEQVANLAGDRFEVKIIESDLARCQRLAEICPDAEIINSDGRNVDTLLEEGIDYTDAFISLTDSSETNILTSLSAKEFGVKKTIAEVEDLQFVSLAESLNIGTIINKKLLLSGCILQAMIDADVESSKFMALADADVAEIEVRPGARATKAKVKDLGLSHDITIAGLLRDGKGMLVRGDSHIAAGDHVVVIFLNSAMSKVEKLFI